MPATVIDNFCSNYVDQIYPLRGLRAIKNMVVKSIDEDDTKAQLTLMVHVSKMQLTPNESTLHFTQYQEMCLITELTSQLDIWYKLAMKVLEHKEVSKMYTVFSSALSSNLLSPDS